MLNPCWAGGCGSCLTSQFWLFCYQDLFQSHSAPRDLCACHVLVYIGLLSETTWGCGQGGMCGMLWYLPRQSILRTRSVGAPTLRPHHSQVSAWRAALTSLWRVDLGSIFRDIKSWGSIVLQGTSTNMRQEVTNLWLYRTPLISIFYNGDLGESYNN